MMRGINKKDGGARGAAAFRVWLVVAIVLAVMVGPGKAGVVLGKDSPAWFRIRTNSIPHQPLDVVADPNGGLWVTAQDGTEYFPAVWHMPSGAPGDPFRFITNDERNNYLSSSYIDIDVKPQLATVILYAVKDSMGNTWYSLKNRNVLCEKADGGWLTFTMQDTSYMGYDSTGVDSAHRVRLIADGVGNTTGILLISARGVKYLNSQLTITQSREVYSQYNNDFINDVLVDSQGRFWVASNRGLEQGVSLLNTEWVSSKYTANPAVPGYDGETPITRIQEDSLGNIWFSSNSYGTDGVYCYTVAGQWVKYDLDVLVSASNTVAAMAAGSDGKMWFCPGASGIVRYDPAAGGHWQQFATADFGLKSQNVISLAVTGGRLWFVTDYEPSVRGNGTGVYCLTQNPDGSLALAATYTYRGNSTSLTSNRFNFIAADKSGGVWFPAYDDPSVARFKADGTWQHFRGSIDGKSLGDSGIVGVAVDSQNIVYFAPQNAPPVAYDVAQEQAVALPDPPYQDFYYYSLYIDAADGKWFCGSFGVYYLDADNSGWTRYQNPEISQFADNYVDSARVDDDGNAWFMTRYGLTLMKKATGGGVEWLLFQDGDASGYSGGYRVYVDDAGGVWNAARQKFDPANNTWQTSTDTSALDHRHLRFTNGWLPVDMDLSDALPWVTSTDQNRMTLDTSGNVYFAYGMGWLQSVNAGIVVRSPVKGDVDRNGKLDLADAISASALMVGTPSKVQSSAADINGDGKSGLAEFVYLLQRLADLR